MNIARQDHMVAIKSVGNRSDGSGDLRIDRPLSLTAASEGRPTSCGARSFQGWKNRILAVQSTAAGQNISRVVPNMKEGAGVTLTRGDIHYVVTEYGICYIPRKFLGREPWNHWHCSPEIIRPSLIDKKAILVPTTSIRPSSPAVEAIFRALDMLRRNT